MPGSLISLLIKASGDAYKEIDKTSKSVDNLGRSVASASGKSFNIGGLGTSAQAAGLVVATLVAATAALAVTAQAAIDVASDLNETVSKTGVIFGQSADSILQWSTTTAQSIGIARGEALDAAASFATFGKAAGLSGDNLAYFSEDLVQLQADLASFYNTSTEQAGDAIGAALRGESEPIRAYGVMLDDATLRQKAFELGIVSSIDNALTPQQKALAAAAAIYEQTKDAQGDFERTSGGLANQQKILAATLKDTQAAIGTALLPAMVEFYTAANAIATEVMPAIANATKQATPALTDLAEAIVEPFKPEELRKGIGELRGMVNDAIDGMQHWGNASIDTYNSMLLSLDMFVNGFYSGINDVIGAINTGIAGLNQFDAAIRKVNAGQALLRGDMGAALALSQPGVQIPQIPQAVRSGSSYAVNSAVPYLQFGHWEDTTRAADDFSDAIRGVGASADKIQPSINEVLQTADFSGATESAKAHRSAISELEKTYNDLKGKVSSALQGATSLDSIGVDPSKYLPKGDAIQEDAFRLADVMVKGFDSPWADYFKIQFPKMWAEISANGDIKAGAAKVLQEFQAGMRPDLLNFDQLKETVKQQLLSEQAFAGMAQQITDQLVSELGVSAGQVQSALAGVAGGLPGGGELAKSVGADMTGTGNEAGSTFMAGFSASTNGATIVTTITTQIQAVIGQFNTNGRKAGEQWGTGFYAGAETSIGVPLINLIATLVTPVVLANIAATGSRNGAK